MTAQQPRAVYTGRGDRLARRPGLTLAEQARQAATDAALAADHNLVVVEQTSGDDDWGRSDLVTHWWGYRPGDDTWGTRSQVFHTRLHDHAQTWRDRGHTVQMRPHNPAADTAQ